MGITEPNRKQFADGMDKTATTEPYPGYILTYGPVVETTKYGAVIQYPSAVDGTGALTTSLISFEGVKGVYLYDKERETFS